MSKRKINACGNMAAMILGLLFLGDILELWSFHPFDGWWLLFLYIPVVCGLLTQGITSGGVMLACTAIALTVGMFMDIDGRVWSVVLLVYLAYIGWRSIQKDLNTTANSQETQNER